MKRALLVLIACCGADGAAPAPPVKPTPTPPPAPVSTEEVWLRGTTHVHGKPSGDSNEPIPSVIHWYEQHGYDFIALTDHNRVTVLEHPPERLIVLPGVELTHNPEGCIPAGDATNRCRIHVNAIGVSGRPVDKIMWANHHSKVRVELYQAAFDEANRLGAAIVQINHPNYYWGMTPEVLAQIGKHAQLVEIANVQFAKWNAGDADHPSVEAEWDYALQNGVKLWGVASDDAHDYDEHNHGKYPPGGGWVMVKARRDPQAILDALAKGRFYASTGVTLSRAEVVADELVVEAEPGSYTIEFIENGKSVATVKGTSAKRALPQTGYVRAVVTRDDGKKAWVQPASRER